MRWRTAAVSLAWAVSRDLVIPVLLAVLVVAGLHRFLYPSEPGNVARTRNDYGTVVLHVQLPGTHAELPEPLLSCGQTGNASLVFIRLLPHARARVGIDFWGLELDESPDFALPAADATIEVACDLPALYPPVGDPAWGTTALAVQQKRQHEFRISVNGSVQLAGAVNYVEPAHSPLYLGANPLGGSYVTSLFSGHVLGSTQKL